MSEDNNGGGAGDMNLGSQTAQSMVGKLIQAVIGFAGTILFARILGPTSFGGFYFLLTLVNISDRPARGVISASRKRFSEANAPQDEIIGAATLTVLVVGGMATSGAFLLRNQLVTQTSVERAPVVFGVLMFTILLFLVFQGLLGSSGKLAGQVWLDTARSIFTFPLQITFVTAGFSAAGMGYGLAGASLLSTVIAIAFLRPKISVPSRETMISLWKFARFSIPATIIGKAYNKLDTLLIGFLIGPSVVGHYEAAFKLTVPATFVYSVIGAGLMPKVSNLTSKGVDVGEDITNALAYSSVFAIPMFFGGSALANELVVTAFGDEYRAAAPFLIGLTLYRVGASQSEVYKSVLDGVDRADLGLRIDAVTTFINVLLGLVLLQSFGAIGVVVASIIAEWLRYAFAAYSLNNLIDLELFPRPLLSQVFAGVLMGAFVESLSRILVIRGWLELVSLVGTGAVLYALALLTISSHARYTTRTIFSDLLDELAGSS